MIIRRTLPVIALLLVTATCTENSTAEDLTLRSASELSAMIADGRTSSAEVTAAYLKRIQEIDDSGPTLNAVVATFPDALDQARILDAEAKAGKIRGPLHGIPVLIKDNIEAKGPLPTTAGSLALKDNITGRDAPIIAKLRAAGAVILGKTNLSEWANIRSNNSTSGWSAVGGLTKNPHALDRNSCGSSSGSGAAAAARLAPLTIGTETDGSITCPASINGVVGLKPTVGLLSRTHIIPISHSQDTPGPMTRNVRDAAMMLNIMAGSDAADAATGEADAKKVDYVKLLDANALKGKRIGYIRQEGTADPVFDAALEVIRSKGAELIEVKPDNKTAEALGEPEFKVLLTELKADLAAYLQGLPNKNIPHKTLADIIAFNKANAKTELAYFGQEIFELAEKQAGLGDADYLKARDISQRMAGKELLDPLFDANRLDAIVAQTNGPAWLSNLKDGDKFTGPSVSRPPAISGYPHLTVPMGQVGGLPVGLSFIGRAWDEANLLAIGYAYEQASKKLMEPTFGAAAK